MEDDVKRGPGMKPMFLPGVERNPKPGRYADLIAAARKSGGEYPQIWHMLAYHPATEDLSKFTQAMLREEAPLTPGIRELIAAYTSYRNDCPF